MGIISYKSTTPYSESTSLCTRDDITMVDEWKQSTTTSSTHMKKYLLINMFHDGLKAWIDLYRHCVYPESYLRYAFSIYKAKYDNPIGESPWRSWHSLACIITRWLCFYNARLFNDDTTAIGVSYWRRREFPNYARLHLGRVLHHHLVAYHGYAMRKILPLCRKTVTCKSKGFLCLFGQNSRIHCFWLKNLNLFSQNITFRVIAYLNLVEKIIRNWNVDDVSVPIISKDIR